MAVATNNPAPLETITVSHADFDHAALGATMINRLAADNQLTPIFQQYGPALAYVYPVAGITSMPSHRTWFKVPQPQWSDNGKSFRLRVELDPFFLSFCELASFTPRIHASVQTIGHTMGRPIQVPFENQSVTEFTFLRQEGDPVGTKINVQLSLLNQHGDLVEAKDSLAEYLSKEQTIQDRGKLPSASCSWPLPRTSHTHLPGTQSPATRSSGRRLWSTPRPSTRPPNLKPESLGTRTNS